VQGLAIRTALVAALACSAPAAAQDAVDNKVDFTLGRVPHTTPDKLDRIGIRSSCAESAGCTVDYMLMRGTSSLGASQFMLLGNTVETDYVTLSKRTAAALRRRRVVVTITAKVRDPAGNEATYTKQVTLGPKKKRR
jgi:hypothetical protein